MARGGRAAPKMPADHKMIRQELASTTTEVGNDGRGVRGRRGRGQTEAEPRSKTEIIVAKRELGPRGRGNEPAGGPGLPQAEEVGG